MLKILALLLISLCASVSSHASSYFHAPPPAPVAVEAVYSAPHEVNYGPPTVTYAAPPPAFIKYSAPSHHIRTTYAAAPVAPVIKYTLGTPVTTTTTTYSGFAAPPPPVAHYAAPPPVAHYAAPPAVAHYSAPPPVAHYAAPPPALFAKYAAPHAYHVAAPPQPTYHRVAYHAAPPTITYAAPVAVPEAQPCDTAW